MNRNQIEFYVRLYRTLLPVLSPRFQESYGSEMISLFRLRLSRAEERHGRLSTLFCASAGVLDLVRTGVVQRLTEPENYRLPSQKGDSVFNRFSMNARLALRNMMRAPAFAATVLATLALGTGTTIAMFGLVDATLIRPLPYPNSERLVAVENIDAKSGPGAFAPPYIDDLRHRINSLDRIVGFWPS